MTEADGRPIILLVEEDDETRPLLRRNLEREGYRVLVAVDEQDARERVAADNLDADLILVNLVGEPPEKVLESGRRIREHARHDGRMPLVVLAEKYGADLEGTDANPTGNDWITYPEDHEQLRRLLHRLTRAAA